MYATILLYTVYTILLYCTVQFEVGQGHYLTFTTCDGWPVQGALAITCVGEVTVAAERGPLPGPVL